MITQSLVVDVLVAALIAAVLWLVLSGVALAGLVAVVVLAVCGITLLYDRRRAHVRARRRNQRRR